MVVPPDLTCSIGSSSFMSWTTDPSASRTRNRKPNPNPDAEVKYGAVATVASMYEYLVALRLMLSWNAAEVEFKEEEKEPKSVLDTTVSFRDCE